MAFKFNPLTQQLDITGSGSGVGMSIGGGITGSTDHAILIVDGSGNLGELGPLTDGQLIIGSTGASAVAASLTGTSNQISVAIGAGSITLSTPQDIHSGASPTFAGLTINGTTTLDSGLTGVLKATAGVVSSSAVSLTTEVSGVLAIANGGTNSSTALNNSRVMVSSGGAIVETAAITASRALISDGSGYPTHSATTSTELGFVSGVTSGIQSQLNAKALDADVIKKDGSVAFTGNQSMGGNKLTGLAAPSANGDALRFDQLGANSGIATLDGGGKVPYSQLPSTLLVYQGTWAASTNTPTLANGTGTAGDVYIASDAGTVDFGAGGIAFLQGDWAIYNGTVWEKSINSNAVASVNGQTGIVTVNAINELTGDITAGPASGSESKVATIATGAVTASKIATGTITNTEISGSAAIVDTKLATISTSGKVSNSATTATASDTPNTILLRDGSGQVAATTFTGNLTGNASGTAANVTGVVAIANGGTNSSAALNNDRIVVSSAGALVEAAALTNGQLLVGSTGAAPVAAVISGTTNRVSVTVGAGSITLSGPQDLHSGATPTFSELTLTATTSQIALGTTQTVTINAPTPVASFNLTIPDAGADAEIVLTEGPLQAINSDKSLAGTISFPNLTASLPLQLNATNEVIAAAISLSSAVTGVLGTSSGGTGQNSSATFPTSGTVAVVPSSGVVKSNGTVLSSSNVNLTSEVSNVLPIANGGTNLSTTPTDGQLLVGNGTGYTLATITGTSNQISVANASGSITLSTPQNIHAGASPTFVALNLTANSNQLVLDSDGGANALTITSGGGAAARTYTVPDVGTTASFVMTEGDQTINGNKTLSGTVNLSALTGSSPLRLDAGKNIVVGATSLTADVSGVLPVANGGTNSSTALNNNRIMVSSAGAITEAAALTDGQLLIGSTGAAPSAAAITGTANQVSVTLGAGSITLATPQNIHSGASPTFVALNLTADTNQLVLNSDGSGNALTLNSGTSAAARTYTIPDVGTTGSFVLTEGTQTINGAKTFTSAIRSNTSLVLEDPGAGSNTTTIQADTVSTSYTLTLPSAVATVAGSALVSDTSGGLTYTPVVAASVGDIPETAFTFGTDIVTNQNVTGLAFAAASVGAFEALVRIEVVATANQYAIYKLYAVNNGASWNLSQDYTGDNSSIVFNITNAGQVQYSRPVSSTGFVATNMRFRATVVGV